MSEDKVRRVRVPVGALKDYDIEIGEETLWRLGEVSRRSLPTHARKLVVVSNRAVFDLYGKQVVASLRGADFTVAHWLMGDGEGHKSLRTAGRALEFLSDAGLERSDALVALGGGVVGDLTGFAAAIYLRGVAYIQVPTTLLAQVDASVGGKTAVNTRRGKNLIGAFHHPRAVVIDTKTLETLPPRELTAGWCEAIKQGAAGSRALFEQTRRFLANGSRAFEGRQGELAELIAAQCAFKAGVVADDEREEVERTDHRSRRILNFGHTVAHALEAVTRYRRFRHGEAVGHGMLVASEISVRLGLLDVSELELLRETVALAGCLPPTDGLDEGAILRALALDKKVVGGHVRWVLLEKLGRARIVNGREISPRVVRASLRTLLRHSQNRP